MKKTLAAIALLLLAPAVAGLQTKGGSELFPFAKGAVWVYEGRFFQSTDHGVIEKTSRWEMRVLDVQPRGDMEVALVTGFPLAYDPEARPPAKGGALIVRDAEGRYSLLSAQAGSEAPFETIPGEEAIREALTEDDLIWVPNPRVGLRFAEGPDYHRDDGWYCWRVIGWRGYDLGAIMKAPPDRFARRWVLKYSTGGDDQICDYAPGVGMVRFVYLHHGTLIQSYVKLVELRLTGDPPPGASGTVSPSP